MSWKENLLKNQKVSEYYENDCGSLVCQANSLVAERKDLRFTTRACESYPEQGSAEKIRIRRWAFRRQSSFSYGKTSEDIMAEGLSEESVEDVNDNTIIQTTKDTFGKRMEVFPARVDNSENGRIVKDIIYQDLKIKTEESHNGGEIIKKSADTNEINGNLLKTADKHDFCSNNKMQVQGGLGRTPKEDELASKKEMKQEKCADDAVVAEPEVNFKDQEKTESKDKKRKAEELDEKPRKIVKMGNGTSKFHLKDKENKNVKSTGTGGGSTSTSTGMGW